MDAGLSEPDAGLADAGAPYTCRRGLGVCAFPIGTFVDGGCDYGPDYEPAETRCDGLDNDCDGVVDGFADGGALRAANCPLTRGVCSGATAVCVDGGYQACDYGPDFQALETRCDGLDNDCDGLVDGFADGGALRTANCPLTRGVCIGATAVCVDGGYQACDYGPDFQALETRCDGLDNDCDGRVDVSRSVVLLEGDAGLWFPAPQLTYFDLQYAQTQQNVDGGFVISTPNQVLWLDDRLGVRRRLLVPASPASSFVESGRLLPRGDHWLRLQLEHSFSPDRLCVVAFEVGGNGSLPLSPDGGLVTSGSFCAAGLGWGALGARVLADGTILVLAWGFAPAKLWRVEFQPDGGTIGDSVDAGAISGDVARILTGPSSFVTSVENVIPSSLIQCDSKAQSCTTTRSDAYCTAIRTEPVDQYCFDAGSRSSFQFADGGIVPLPRDTRWSYLPDQRRTLIQSTLDGGPNFNEEPTWLSVFDRGTLTRVVMLPAGNIGWLGMTLTPTGDRLALLTFYDWIPGTGVPMFYRSFSGEYVCLP